MDTPAARNAAYAEFLAGLIDLREDVATGRFDDTLARLIAEGAVDSGTGDLLRFWQREALRNQSDQLVATAAAALAALDESRQEAIRAVAAAEDIWATATAAPPRASSETSPRDLRIESGEDPMISSDDSAVHGEQPAPGAALGAGSTTPPAAATPVEPSAEARTDVAEASTASPEPEPEPVIAKARGRHRAPSHAAPVEPPAVASAGDASAPEVLVHDQQPHVPQSHDPAPAPEDQPPPAAPAPARRRRLLVAGLTVVDKADDPPESPTRGHPAVG